MGSSWQSLLDSLHAVRTGDFRNDVDRREHLIEEMAFTLQTILEKLRDADDARSPQATVEGE